MWGRQVKQHDRRDCGAACLATICNYYGIKTSLVEARELAYVDKLGVSVYGISQAAEKLGLKSEALEGSMEELLLGVQREEIRFPIIAHIITKENLGHYIILKKYYKGMFYVFDPAKGNCRIKPEDFNSMWTGVIITFEKRYEVNSRNKKRKKNSSKIYFEVFVGEWRKFVLTFLLSIIICFITILGTWVYKIVIDNYILHTDSIVAETLNSKSSIWVQQIENVSDNFEILFITLLGLYIFQATLLFLRGQILNFVTKGFNKKLSLKFYGHLIKTPLNFFERRESGEILTRYQSILELQDLFVDTLLTLILESLMAVAGGIILFRINTYLFMLVVIMVLLYAILTVCFVNPLKYYTRRLQESDADVTTFLNESIDGIERIKADVIENQFMTKFENRIQNLVQNIYKLSTWQNIITSAVICIESIGVLLILWQGSSLVMKGVISLGTLISFESLVQFFVTPIKNLINVQVTIHNLIIIINRLNDVLDVEIEDERSEQVLGIDNQITLNNIEFSYGYQEPVFNDLNINFQKNIKYGIIGKSGSGKSTLLKLIAILEKPQKGDILFGNVDTKNVNEYILRKNIGYTSQKPYLFTGTLAENLYLDNMCDDKEYRNSVLHITGLSELIEELPGGEEFRIAENGNNLSGGQKQKILLCRVLLKRPKILILDEATSNLDSTAEDRFFRFLSKELPNTTVIATFHNLELAKYFDNIIFLENGKVVVEGEHKQLLNESTRYKNFFV